VSKYDFRPFVPKPDYHRVVNLGRDHYEHAERAAANPRVQKMLLEPWAKLYEAPFVGITTDGTPRANLFSRKPNGAPVEAMAAAATNLLAALSPEQRKAVQFAVNAPDWRRWNNTEIYLYQYGLRLEELSESVRDGVLAVVRASLSPTGYEKTRDVMRLNLFLGELVGNTKVMGEFSYNFALFGAPSTSEPWGWQLMGHHLALNCIVVDGQLVLSPTFMGAEPNFADTGPFEHVHLFQDEENGGLALIRSLSSQQLQQAIVNHSILGTDQPPGRWHPADHPCLAGRQVDLLDGTAVAGRGEPAEHPKPRPGTGHCGVPDGHWQVRHLPEGPAVGGGEHGADPVGPVVAANEVGRAAQGHRRDVGPRPGEPAGHGGGALVPQRLHGGEFRQIATAEQVWLAAKHRPRRIVGRLSQFPRVGGPAGNRIELDDRTRGGQLLGDAADYQQVLAASEHDLPGDRRREAVGRPGDLQGQRCTGSG